MLKTSFAALLALLIAVSGGIAGAWLVLQRTVDAAPGWWPARMQALPLPPAEGSTFPLPLGLNEGAAFTAARSDDGEPLRAACTYRIAGPLSPSRFWTLAATAPTGAQSGAIQSLGTLRHPKAAIAVIVSRRPNPVNWLPLRADDRFTLTLTLFGAALTADPVPAETALPRVERLDCDG